MKLYAAIRNPAGKDLAFKLMDHPPENAGDYYTIVCVDALLIFDNMLKAVIDQIKVLTGKTAHFEH